MSPRRPWRVQLFAVKNAPTAVAAPDVYPDTREAALLLTVSEAACMLRIGRTTLYELVWQGRLEPVRIGRSVRFTRASLERFVAALEK